MIEVLKLRERWNRVDEPISSFNPQKPLGIKAYCSICHLPGSRLGVGTIDSTMGIRGFLGNLFARTRWTDVICPR